jgi:micrococcal nuclease
MMIRRALGFVMMGALALACSLSAGESAVVGDSNTGRGAPPSGSVSAQVIDVIDGDTIDVTINGRRERVRLIGIDTPERGNCYYREASDFLDALVNGREVWLEADSSQDDRDRYDRLLRFIWLADGRMANALLVEGGYAFEYTFRTAYRYQATFMQGEESARRGGAGLWSASTCNGMTE